MAYQHRYFGPTVEMTVGDANDLQRQIDNGVALTFVAASRGSSTSLAMLVWCQDGSVRFEGVGDERIVRMCEYDASVIAFKQRVKAAWVSFTEQQAAFHQSSAQGPVRSPYVIQFVSAAGHFEDATNDAMIRQVLAERHAMRLVYGRNEDVIATLAWTHNETVRFEGRTGTHEIKPLPGDVVLKGTDERVFAHWKGFIQSNQEFHERTSARKVA